MPKLRNDLHLKTLIFRAKSDQKTVLLEYKQSFMNFFTICHELEIFEWYYLLAKCQGWKKPPKCTIVYDKL